MRLAGRMMAATAILGFTALSAAAQAPAIPSFWEARERQTRPDLTQVTRLRFLTTVDFAPFNYLDASGSLAGFHVDLAREICRELDLEAVCQIQALPWDELRPALAAGEGEAIIAGMSVTAELRESLAFSRTYLKFPARFVVQAGAAPADPMWQWLSEKRVGVLDGTMHEAMLRDHFAATRPVVYSRSDLMTADLKRGTIDAVFGDGMRLAFWLDGEDAAGCCRFAGGPYLLAGSAQAGLTIAVSADRPELAQAMDFALREIDVNGKFAELYLRHFPVSFY